MKRYSKADNNVRDYRLALYDKNDNLIGYVTAYVENRSVGNAVNILRCVKSPEGAMSIVSLDAANKAKKKYSNYDELFLYEDAHSMNRPLGKYLNTQGSGSHIEVEPQ